MMLHVVIPKSATPRRLVFYLAMEEYLAQHCTQELFFTWCVEPTVICGRHQVIESEVNLDFCREQAIQIYRRKSGGGCVYADLGNLMMSYISPNLHFEEVFQNYLDKVTQCLKKQGLAAAKSTHNDVLIGDRKVSGNACYATKMATIVHGTLLFDVDFEKLEKAITPAHEKLAKHGVQSVRQRVANLSQLTSEIKSIEQLEQKIITDFCDGEYCLSSEEIQNIEAIEQTYLVPEFIND